MIKLFVSGFPLEITELELAKLIAPHGDISTIKIVRDKKTRKCKGYAFVEMVTEDGAAEAVVALNGTIMHDRELTVKLSEDHPVAPPKRRFASPAVPTSGKRYEPEAARFKRPRKHV